MRTIPLLLAPDGIWTLPDGAAIPSGEQLVLGFWSDLDDSTVLTHARSLRALLPNALILGCSSSGVIHGRTLRDAVMEAGAVRLRRTAPTAPAVVVAGLVMVLDPIFQGLAVALMSGAVVATLLTMVVVPLLYWELRRRQTPAVEG